MNAETIVLLTILVPIIGSFAAPLAGLLSRRARSIWSILVSAVTAVLPLTLIPLALQGGEIVVRKSLALGLDFVLIIDPLSIFMAGVSSFVGFLIVVYSVGYIHKEENQNEYYLMVLLFIGAMMGLVFSGNLIFLYLFW
ncbi:MAG TPA: NADH-quinone oxidoreductase subunit L, partial [Candidatus Latescibacteria bacterium]|nr:NADH-quinone oxidoreductase subunit L [Candidatus Latescibacterota bacterium]